MLSPVSSLFLLSGLLEVVGVGATPLVARDGPSPALPYDTNTSKYCTWWVDLTSTVSCASFLSNNYVTIDDLRRWNPSITADCGNMVVGKSYCVEAIGEPPVPTTSVQAPTVAPSTSLPSTSLMTTVSSLPSTTTIIIPSTTTPGNGVQTPLPTQPGMVSNCAKFHWIAKNVVCSQVISYQKITLADFVKWNPTVRDDCSGMWAEVNVCVGIIGGSPTTSKPTTTTTAGNGVQTPQPTQPGMVTNCARFHYVAAGVICSQITSYQKISLADFIKWNPTVGSDCSKMQAGVNVCVGVIGGTTTTDKPTTTAGNGIQTPLPTQPGMVTNCKKFHYAAEGVVCSQIISYQKISLADFLKWNTGISSDCRNMWANTHTCVGV
ncbi:putative LysM domain-containing protein [Stagonosporopsis vannaccii]|nr:putative LysM domain-containing protein [Stagonosporopsis vannaccii]